MSTLRPRSVEEWREIGDVLADLATLRKLFERSEKQLGNLLDECDMQTVRDVANGLITFPCIVENVSKNANTETN